MPERKCCSCKKSLHFFPSEDNSFMAGIYNCVNEACELEGMQQPEREGQSIVGFGSDGNFTVIRKGSFSENEGNLPVVSLRLGRKLDNWLNVTPFDGPEAGVDLLLRCEVCNVTREIQVTRAIDPKFAKEMRSAEVSWRIYRLQELVDRLINVVYRKTTKHSNSDKEQQILLLDCPVDILWPVVLEGLTAAKQAVADTGWYSIAMLGPDNIIAITGSEPSDWCSCGKTRLEDTSSAP